MKRLIFITLIISLSTPSLSQLKNNYVLKTFYFYDSLNYKLINKNTDNLATILVDGYLLGKLKGYKYDVRSEVVKREEPLSFKGWNENEKYLIGDRIQYKGKFYEAINDNIGISPESGYRNDYWDIFNNEGRPLKSKYYFPNFHDTLPKLEFLKNMVKGVPEIFPNWDANKYYYYGDIVIYNGRTYEAIKEEIIGRTPSDYEDYWIQTSHGQLEFFLSSDFKAIQILYFISDSGELIPQIITPLIEYNEIGFHLNIGLHFVFNEAMSYINKQSLPLLYQSNLAFIGAHELIMDMETRFATLAQIKEKLVSKKIKVKDKDIFDPVRFQKFLLDTSKISVSNPNNFILMQKLSNELILSELKQNEYDYEAFPFLKISIRNLKKLFKDKPEIKTIQEAILNEQLNYRLDSLSYDSLFPNSTSKPIVEIDSSPAIFYENFKAKVSSSNIELNQQMAHLWSLIYQGNFEKKLEFKNPFQSPYPCYYNWSNTEIDLSNRKWTFHSTFSLGSYPYASYYWGDSIPSPHSFKEISVTYKRKLTDSKSLPQFTPVELSIILIPILKEQVGDDLYPTKFTFDWAELKSLIDRKGNTELKKLSQNIESGNLDFYDSNLVYGLVKESPK